MAELPGWDRDRLATAPGADVEAARWLVYARELRPEVTFNYPAHIRAAEVEAMTGHRREREIAADRKRQLEALRAGQRQQADMREGLLLDGEDEPEEDDLVEGFA